MREPPADPTGPVRKPDQPLARPKDAATLVLYRRRNGAVEVLMGERHAKHRFMPNRYVFPGGRVDRADWHVRAGAELHPAVSDRLSQSCPPRRARALALAAIRETFEETGLMLGTDDPNPGGRTPPSWQPFFAAGMAPALDCLDYVARAVTPPYRPMRFNARFFMADATLASGEIKGSGELLDLRWVPIAEACELPIPRITGLVLGHVEEVVGAPGTIDRGRPVHLYDYLHGRHRQVHE